jgi:hypothetical protein
MKAIGKTVAHRRMSGIGTYSFRFKSPYWIYRISRIYALRSRPQSTLLTIIAGKLSAAGWSWAIAVLHTQWLALVISKNRSATFSAGVQRRNAVFLELRDDRGVRRGDAIFWATACIVYTRYNYNYIRDINKSFGALTSKLYLDGPRKLRAANPSRYIVSARSGYPC